ncbi:hypothetical protein SAMN05421823_104259 [Catalinimonas alkaloidigena]|uniref:Tetratricopeptide repeat-containing protein n=2 Tax=Catalinimonas alkaloidigena TaxID=1075417 RepID=A0A1G9GYJ9_9BACT|nr:hypothetical protein SAMN05421823_104259 [Catalinimonas alkaloidigena]
MPLLFWRWWERPYRWAYLLLLALLGGLMSLFAWYYLAPHTGAVHWEIKDTLDYTEAATDQFHHYLGDFVQETVVYLITQKRIPADLDLNLPLATLCLGLFWLGIAVVMAVASGFSRFWFLTITGLMLFFLAFARLELLSFLGLDNSWPLAGAMALMGGLSYYIHAFRPRMPLWQRLLPFVGMSFLVGLALVYGAEVPQPVFQLLNYSAPLLVGVTLFFILLTAIDIPYALLTMVTRSGSFGQSNATFHFTLLTALYLFNLIVRYLSNRGLLEWDLMYLDAFLILGISTVLGLRNFARRERQYQSILSFRPGGAFLFLALALMSFACLTWYQASDHDAMIEMFEDAITLSFAGFGAAFYFYILINFGSALRQGLPIHRIAFEPFRVPYAGVTLFAVAGIGIALFNSGLFPVYQGISSYYTGLGDIYRLENNALLAEQYYREALEYEYRNHRTNYALATLARAKDDQNSTTFYFDQALEKAPTEESWVGLSESYLRRNQFFDALFTLQESVEAFPESPTLYNNLALLYYGTGILDSTYYYLQRAKEVGGTTLTATNLLAFVGKNHLYAGDTSFLNESHYNTLPWLTNEMANRAAMGRPSELKLNALPDSVLDNASFSFLYNLAVTRFTQPDPKLIERIERYLAVAENELYSEDLRFVHAELQMRQGQRASALPTLMELQESSTTLGATYGNHLGLWLFQMGTPRYAADFFASALERGYDTRLHLAAALTAAGDAERARRAWINLLNDDDEGQRNAAAQVLRAVSGEMEVIQTLAEPFRVAALDVNQTLTMDQKWDIWRSLQQPALRYWGGASLLKALLQQEDFARGEELARQLPVPDATVPTEARDAWWIQFFRLKLLMHQPEAVAAAVDSLSDPGWKPYFKGAIALQNGQNEQALPLLQEAFEANPLVGDIVVTLADLYQRMLQPQVAYDQLLTALSLNPYNRAAHEAYILQALRLNLIEFADESYTRYKDLYKDHTMFESQYTTARTESLRALEQF